MLAIPRSHPYWHVREFVQFRPEIAAVSMSYYSYAPRTVTDVRSDFLLKASDFVEEESLTQLINQVPAGRELAMQSTLQMVDGSRRHLVLVDMSTAARAHLEKLRNFLDENFFQAIAWFASGRSFHGYGDSLLTSEEWVRFMGLLLLANQPRLEPTVDPRWIGHRLLAGYSALRWTCNTSHYLSLPKKIAITPKIAPAKSDIGPVGKRLGKGVG